MESSQTARARFVVLGASNVVLGMRAAVLAAQRELGAPLEVVLACGHGRSYVTTGNVFGRELPALTKCGVWEELATRPPLPTYAIVTDAGNDIAFGFESAEISRSVETCATRLVELGAKVVMTGLPLAVLERIPAWQFRFFASLFFPQRRIDRERALAGARELDASLAKFAGERGIERVVPESHWYGLDPIHVRAGARNDAWRAYTAAWSVAGAPESAVVPWELRGRIVSRDRVLFGRPAGRAQPCASLADGSHFFAY